MAKQLNDNELDKVAGGGNVSYSEIGDYVGRTMWFFTNSHGFSSGHHCGWVKVLAFEDPYVYAEPCDQNVYEKMKKAYEVGCALEPCTYNGISNCFKIDYGTWHATYLYTYDCSMYL